MVLQHSLQYCIYSDTHAKLKQASLSTRMARTSGSINYAVLFCRHRFRTKLTQLSPYHYFIITTVIMQDSSEYWFVRNLHLQLFMQP